MAQPTVKKEEKKEDNSADHQIRSFIRTVLHEKHVLAPSATGAITVYVNTNKELSPQCNQENHPACFIKDAVASSTPIMCFQITMHNGRVSYRETRMHPTLPLQTVHKFMQVFMRLDGITPSELVFVIIKSAVDAQEVTDLVSDQNIHHLQNQVALGKAAVWDSVRLLTNEANNLDSTQLIRMEKVSEVTAQAFHVSSKFSRMLQEDSDSSAFKFMTYYLDAQLKSSVLKSVWKDTNMMMSHRFPVQNAAAILEPCNESMTSALSTQYTKNIGEVFAFLVWIQTNMSAHMIEGRNMQLTDESFVANESLEYLAKRFSKLGTIAWFASLNARTQNDVLNEYNASGTVRKYIE